MELFFWLWLWDKRVICGLKYPMSPKLLSNLWLLPFVINMVLIVLQGSLGQPAFVTEGKTGVSLYEAKKLAMLYDGECVKPW